jgi:uncharacterized membrane protein YphA (DoxX/SURF4 family)
MTTSATHRPAHISGATTRVAAYWISTAILGAECLGGGVMGALRLPPFIHTATHLGYPAYFMTILGVWYVLAGIVVLAPRLPRLKEWAYAGLIFNYTGAAFSHVWMGDSLEKLVGPVIFIGLTLTSWALRPEARRAFNTSPLPAAGFSRKRVFTYWIATVIVATELAVGGVWDMLRIDLVRGVVEHLGYPTYLLVIMGAWKLPGAAALLMPGFPRIKEWAYAGAVITYASAVASHVSVGDGIGRVVAPTVLLALTLVSWALRPPRLMSRRPRVGADEHRP